MRKQILNPALFALALGLLAACGSNDATTKTENKAAIEIRKDKMQNGNIQEEYEFDKNTNLKHGKSKFFYEDGKVMIEQSFAQGKLDGKQTYFHPNGQKKSEITFVQDKQEGAFAYYYEDGKKYQEGTYKNGNIEGQLRTYHPNGQVREVVTLVAGLENGPFEEYNENGILKAKGTYTTNDEGGAVENGILEEYDDTGKLVAKKDCEMGTCYKIWDIEKGDIKPNKIPK